jgi:hypothetical protein
MTSRRFPAPLICLIALAALGGLALLAAAGAAWDGEDIGFLAALVFLAAVSEAVDFAPLPNNRVSLSIAFIAAAGTFSGLSGAAVVALAIALADFAAHPKHPAKAVFNAGTLLLAAGAFVAVLEALSSLYSRADVLEALGPVLLATGAAFVVNSALVTAAIYLDRGGRLLGTWSEMFLWVLPHYGVLGLLGLLMAFSYGRWELAGVLLLLAPLALVWLAVKQYTDRARAGALAGVTR